MAAPTATARTIQPTKKLKDSWDALPRSTRLVIIAIFGALVLGLIIWWLFGGEEGAYMEYRSFKNLAESGQVTEVVINNDRVDFSAYSEAALDGSSAQDTQLISYWTDNPRTDTFKEELLLRGIKVTEAASGDEIFGIILDIFFFVIIVGSIVALAGRLVSFDRTTFKLVHKTGVTFDDIAGMDALKRELGHVVDVLKNPQKYSSRGMRPIKGIVLEGPPGNGKTLFAKALASEAGVNFIATKGADFQSALMSLGARKIRMLFRKAARHTPCIIFIDEFDAIGERRSYAGTGIDKENNRIITAMLNEMDGFTSHDGILVIAATNSYASLDAALVRPGRFDLHYTVGNPDLATRKQLVQIYTAQKTLSPDLTTDALAEKFSGLSCAAIESVLNEAATLAALEGSAQINPTHIEHAAKRVGIKI